jgi:hypothetical protein
LTRQIIKARVAPRLLDFPFLRGGHFVIRSEPKNFSSEEQSEMFRFAQHDTSSGGVDLLGKLRAAPTANLAVRSPVRFRQNGGRHR